MYISNKNYKFAKYFFTIILSTCKFLNQAPKPKKADIRYIKFKGGKKTKDQIKVEGEEIEDYIKLKPDQILIADGDLPQHQNGFDVEVKVVFEVPVKGESLKGEFKNDEIEFCKFVPLEESGNNKNGYRGWLIYFELHTNKRYPQTDQSDFDNYIKAPLTSGYLNITWKGKPIKYHKFEYHCYSG